VVKNDILEAIRHGEVLAEYPKDIPYPSFLILWFKDKKPIHVLVAVDKDEKTCYIITVYRPSADIWTEDFRRRRK